MYVKIPGGNKNDIKDCSCANRNIEKPQPITLTGLILALGLSSRESLDLYQTYDEFIDSVKRAKLLIEYEYENRLVTGTNATSSIFALKNFGWKDKQDIEANLNGQMKHLIETTIVDPKG